MSFDINQLKADEKQLLFKNLVTCDFTMMRGRQPDANDPVWGDNGPPQTIPRKSPYRNSSNVNFLLHNNDEVLKIVPCSKRPKLYKKNNVIEPDIMKGHEIEIEAEKAELKAEAELKAAQLSAKITMATGDQKSIQDSKSTSKQKQLQAAAILSSDGTQEIATRSDVASSTMNPTVDMQFGLFEEDPAIKDLSSKKQFEKYQDEINYDETQAEQKRAETSDQLLRKKKPGSKNDPRSIKNRQQKAEKIVAQREKQFQIAKKYKNQVNESIQRDRMIKTRGASREKNFSPKEQPLSRAEIIVKAKQKRKVNKALEEAARLEAERPKDEWDELMAPSELIEVDGRQINKAWYPKGFDFELIRGMMLAPNEPLYNYNNMVMEQTLLDVNSFVCKRKPPAGASEFNEKYRDVQRAMFWNDKYRSNQQEIMDRKMQNSGITDQYLVSQLPTYFDGIYNGQIIYNMLSWPAQRQALSHTRVNLSKAFQLETESFKNINQRNSFKVRGGPSYYQSTVQVNQAEAKSLMQTSQMDTDRKNDFYQKNNKYVNPKSQRDYYEEIEPQYLQAVNRKRNFTSLSQRTNNGDDASQKSNIKQVFVPNYGAKLPQFEYQDIELFQNSVQAYNERVSRVMSPKSKEKQQKMNTQYEKSLETEFETFRDTFQSTTRKGNATQVTRRRPNLANIIGTPAAKDGTQPLISPHGNSIDGSGEYISDFLSINQAFQQSVMQSKRGRSTLEQTQYPDLLSNSHFSETKKQNHIEAMNNQMQFLKINKKFKVSQEQSERKQLKRVNAIDIKDIKTETKNYQLNLNNTFDQKYVETIEDFQKSVQQPSFFGNPVVNQHPVKARQLSLTDKFSKEFNKSKEQNQQYISINTNDQRQAVALSRMDLNMRQGTKFQDHVRKFELENSFFIPVMVNYNQRRRVKRPKNEGNKFNQDLQPVKIDVSSLCKKNAEDTTPILLLNGTGIQGSPPQSQRKAQQGKTQDVFKETSNVPTNAINSNLSFNPGESQHAIHESITRSDASGREEVGFKSGGSKYSSIHIENGTEPQTKEKQMETKGSIQGDGADAKEEYDIQMASIAESGTSSQGKRKKGDSQKDKIFGENLMKYQFNAKNQMQQQKEKQESNETNSISKKGRDHDLRVDGQPTGVRPQTQAKDSKLTDYTRIIEPTSHLSQHSSILEKIASKENYKPKGGAPIGKAQIAVNQRARTREQTQRIKSRQTQSRTDSRQNPGVRIKNVSSGGRTVDVEKKDPITNPNQSKQHNAMSIESGGKNFIKHPDKKEPETALLDKRGNLGSPSPLGSNGRKDGSHMNTRRTRNHDGDLQQNSTGNNTKRTSVLKVKDGEQIKTSRIYNGQISIPIVYKKDSENLSSQESERIEALKLAELYTRQQMTKNIQHAKQYGRCFANFNNQAQISNLTTARFFSQQSPRNQFKLNQHIASSLGTSIQSRLQGHQDQFNFTSEKNNNVKGDFHLGVTGNIKAYGVSVVNQMKKNPQFADFKISNQYGSTNFNQNGLVFNRGAASLEQPSARLQKKYNYDAEKKNLMFRSKNVDKEILPRKDQQMLKATEGDADDKGGQEPMLSLQSSQDGCKSPSDPRANEQSRSLEQVQGPRMQQPSQISHESGLSGPLHYKSKYTKIVTSPEKKPGKSKGKK